MVWKVPRIWQGGDVWIIGGGPSVTKQFGIPEDIVNKVRYKELPVSAYSDYMGVIKNKHVIGVNIAFMLGTWVDMAFFGDNGFMLVWQNQLAAFPNVRISCNPLVRKYPWIKYLAKDKSKRFGLSSNPNLVCWNGNSGAAAINLAVHTGAKRIFLLGFDMELINSQQHWHNEYRANKKGKFTTLPFNMHLKSFPDIAKDAEEMGVEIINVSPESKINVFPKVSLKEVL